MTARDPLSLEKLFDGDDWRLMDYERTLSFNQAYERDRKQWIARNEGEANKQMQEFKPPFVRHEDIKPAGLSVRAMFTWVGCALVVAEAILLAVLQIWR